MQQTACDPQSLKYLLLSGPLQKKCATPALGKAFNHPVTSLRKFTMVTHFGSFLHWRQSIEGRGGANRNR